MSIHWSKHLLWFVFVLSACQKQEPYRYAGAQKVAQAYLNFNELKDGERILFYSRFTGCQGCRSLVREEIEQLLFPSSLYVVTNSKQMPLTNSRMFYDSLDLINVTDLGFAGPTFLEKQGDKLVYLLEITATNKDSLYYFFPKAKR